MPDVRQISILAAAVLGLGASPKGSGDVGWPVYGGDPGGQHYSSLTQVNRSNVAHLKLAWRFDTGPGGLETSPIVVGRMLYAYTPDQKAIALDAVSGRLLWTFDSGEGADQPARGVTYWSDGAERRLFVGAGHSLYALDPATGRPIASFGEGGKVDLRKDLGRPYETQPVFLTSPGVVFKDLIIVGFRTSETPPAPPGDIRAYDVRTGKLRWSFHTIPHTGEAGAETWPKDAWETAGAANNWTGMVLDERRGIVYVPTGSAVFDFYGGDRKGDDLYADTLLALDAETGRRLWHFQGVHHDLWDRDFPSPPVLLSVRQGGRAIDAVAQATKQGFVFLFDRVTGKPLFPIEERPVPPSDVPGESASPTQPFALKPAPFARQRLTEDMLTTRTREAHATVLQQFRQMRSEGQFVPWSVGRETIIFPGFDGGAEWGGQAVDPKTGVFYVNANDVPWSSALVENTGQPAEPRGARIYQEQCSACHGSDRRGSPPQFPSLVDVGSRLTGAQMAKVIEGGRGRMPGFPQISASDRAELIAYLRGVRTPEERREAAAPPPSPTMPYTFTGYRKFQDPEGYPAVKPPWGTLSAIDLNTGEYVWRLPLGEYPALAAQGLKATGSENYGGPIVTAGGLVIIAATIYDRKIRAFDSRSGKLLWEASLPYAGVATPVTYAVDGRQYIVIATSGARDPKGPQGSAYLAFALPTRTGS